MDIALIEHPQNDIHHQNRRRDQDGRRRQMTTGMPERCPGTSPCSVCGTFSCSCKAWIFATASPSDTPGATLNDSVTDGNWPWWFTVSGSILRPEMGHRAQAAPARR